MPPEDLATQQSGQNSIIATEDNELQVKAGRHQTKRRSIDKSSSITSSSQKADEPTTTIKTDRPKPENQPTENIKIHPSNTKNMPPEPDTLESKREIKA